MEEEDDEGGEGSWQNISETKSFPLPNTRTIDIYLQLFFRCLHRTLGQTFSTRRVFTQQEKRRGGGEASQCMLIIKFNNVHSTSYNSPSSGELRMERSGKKSSRSWNLNKKEAKKLNWKERKVGAMMRGRKLLLWARPPIEIDGEDGGERIAWNARKLLFKWIPQPFPPPWTRNTTTNLCFLNWNEWQTVLPSCPRRQGGQGRWEEGKRKKEKQEKKVLSVIWRSNQALSALS